MQIVHYFTLLYFTTFNYSTIKSKSFFSSHYLTLNNCAMYIASVFYMAFYLIFKTFSHLKHSKCFIYVIRVCRRVSICINDYEKHVFWDPRLTKVENNDEKWQFWWQYAKNGDVSENILTVVTLIIDIWSLWLLRPI